MRTRLILMLLMILGGGAPAVAVDLKIATVAPDGSAWMRAMRQGGEEISRRTAGRVTLKFYAGGVMGNDKSVLRKIRVGQLQGGAFTSGGLADVYPDIGLYSLPLVFRSQEEVDAVRPILDPVLREGLEQAGFVSFGFAEGGFALLMSEVPVLSLDDLRGRKIWVPEGDRVSYRAMESLGLAPVTLPISDVMTGLQARLIEVIASSPIGAVAFQWYTRLKYVTDTPLSYLFATLVIDRGAFQRLDPADREVMREVMGRIYRDLDRQNRLDNAAATKAMAGQGLKFITLTPTEVQRWQDKGAEVTRQLRDEGAFSVPLLDRFQQLLESLRGHPAATVPGHP